MQFLHAAATTLSIPIPTSTHHASLSIPEPLPSHTSHDHHHGHHPTGKPLPPPFPEGPRGPHSPAHYEHIHHTGKVALWVIFGIFTAALLLIVIMAKRVERKLRLFHYITGAVIATAMVSYLGMATGLGWYGQTSYKHAEDGARIVRQVAWLRYADWAITTPLLLLDLALLSGLPLVSTGVLILADIFMIVTGLFASLVQSGERTRWLIYTISCIFYAYVLFTLIFAGRSSAKLQSNDVQKVYTVTSLMIIILWTAYPIIFALTEGNGRLSVDAEVIAYGVFDVLAKVVFGMYLLIAHSHTEGDSVVISDFYTQSRNAGTGYGAIDQDE